MEYDMSKGDPGLFVDYCAKDFFEGTEVLGPWEELAYRRICDMIYKTNNRLRDDDRMLAWATKVGHRWPKIKIALTTGFKPKLEIINGLVTNSRCTEALGKAAQLMAQKASAGRASSETGKSLKNLKPFRTSVVSVVLNGAQNEPQNEPQNQPITQEPSILESPKGLSRQSGEQIAAQMLEIWNRECGDIGLRRALHPDKPNKQRVSACNARFKEHFGSDMEQWSAFVRRVVASSFLAGNSSRGFQATLDWVLTPMNATKILEGNYDDRTEPAAKPNGHSSFYDGPTEPPPGFEDGWVPMDRPH